MFLTKLSINIITFMIWIQCFTMYGAILSILCVIFQIIHYFTNKIQRVHAAKKHDQKSLPKLIEMEVWTSFNQFGPVWTSFTQLCVIGSMPLEHYTGILESWNSGILESSHFKHTRTDFVTLAQFSIGMSNKKNHTFLN